MPAIELGQEKPFDPFSYEYMQTDGVTGEILLFGRRTSAGEVQLFGADDMAAQMRAEAGELAIERSWARDQDEAGFEDPTDDFIRRHLRSFEQ